MTTDNRTNEPTPEQIEAAAQAVREVDARAGLIADVDLPMYRARAALVAGAGAAPAVSGSTSDGYHTFDELYEYRMLYNAHAAHGWLAAGIPVVKSWRHSDGEACFGGEWFIVTATLPSGQVSNHYKAEHWGLFKVPEVDLPPEYDGHTPHDAAMRLRVEAEHAAPVQPSSTVDVAAHDAEIAARQIDAPSVREAIGEVLADMEATAEGAHIASSLALLQEITDAAIRAAVSPPSRLAKRTGYETVGHGVGEHSQKITARAAEYREGSET